MLKVIIAAIALSLFAIPNLLIHKNEAAPTATSRQFTIADIFSDGSVIHGTVTVEKKYERNTSVVALADFKLRLVSMNTNTTVANVETDIFGRYYFPKVKPDTYVIEWDDQNGWAAGKTKQVFDIKDKILYADQIHPEAQENHTIYTGIIAMKNGSAAYFNEYYGIQSMPVIQNEDRSIKQRTDASGQFAISIKDRSINVVINANTQSSFALRRNEHGSYLFKNTIPVSLGFEFKNKLGKIKYAKAGERTTLRALVQDLDGDALTYKWEITGAITKKMNGNTISLTMPKGEGTILAEVVAEDGKGGIAIDKYTIGYGQKYEIFSGIVQERKSNTVVTEADVNVNGKKLKTDANGFFRVLVPIANKYSVTISKLGYTTYGQAYENAQSGKLYTIRKLETRQVNTSNDIVLTDGQAQLSVPKNSLVDKSGKLPTGALNANFSILDITTNEFPGDFIGRDREGTKNLISYGMAEISFYDNQGQKFNLKKGAKAQLILPVAYGNNKRILEKAPTTIPIWTYNTATGEWDKNATATLDLQKGVYIGLLDHFSTINMDQPGVATCLRVLTDPELMNKYLRVSDVAGDGIDYATVKEVQINNALSAIYRIPVNQKVRIEVLDGPGGTPIADVLIDVFDNTQPGLGWVLNANNEVLSGAALADLWPVYPYETCPKTIHLKFQPNANPANPVTDYNAFLFYKGIGSLANANTYYATVDQGNHRLTLSNWLTHNGYTIAPGGIVYGTNADATRYFNTAFLNNNDLGSGRDMHFLKNIDGTASAYVANYGKFDQNHANADKAANRDFIAGDVIATVCMEWSPLDNAANQWIDNLGVPFNKEAGPVFSPGYVAKVEASSITKFFVYTQVALGGGTVRQQSANLDGYQNKFVPNLCNNCHGGSPLAPFEGTHFRELDYRSYKLSGGRLHPAITVAEKNAFQGQNSIVKKNNTSLISSDAIKELIDIWYNDGDNVQQVAIPDNWKKTTFPGQFPNAADHPERLYTNVVAKSCRTCHSAFDGSSGGFDLGFEHYDEFFNRKGPISYYSQNVSSGSVIMPHAAVTHRNFWTDIELEVNENGVDIGVVPINRANYLRHYIDTKWGAAIE